MLRMLTIPAALILLLAGAMIWSGTAAEEPADFTYINRGEIGTLDPKGMSWLQDIRVAYALWEGLYTLDPQTLEAVPGTADRIDLSPDQTVYTFHIRPAARWTNGDPVTAHDFVFAWRRALEEPQDYTYLMYYIRGAKAYSDRFVAGERPDFAQVGIEAIDSRALRVTLEHPVAFFPDLCAFPPFFPLHEPSMRPFAELPDPHTGRISYRQGFTRPPHLVSNGPYRLAAWEFKRRLRLEASEYYWDRASVRSRIIEQVSTPDPQAAFLQYDSGGIDWLAEVPGEIAAELRAAGRPDLHVFPGFGTYFYSFNCNPTLADGQPNPFADVRVRRAFSMAVNKQTIVQTITRMGEQPAANYVPPGIFAGYRSPAGLPFDPDLARRLLEEAGYPGGRGFPRLTLLYNTEGQHAPIAQSVRRQWLETLGVDLSLEGVEIKVFRVRLHNGLYAVARASWIGDYNDVSTFTDKYLSFSENNDSAWKNAEYDRLCAAAARELNPAARLELLSRAEQILLEEAPILPLYYYVNVYLFREHVRGVPLNPRNMVMFKALEARR
jgi:oligopeptide transport system substrate-binding protein